MKTNRSTFNMLSLVCYCVLILLVTYSAVGEWQWHLLIAFSFQLLICLGIVDTCRDQFETQRNHTSEERIVELRGLLIEFVTDQVVRAKANPDEPRYNTPGFLTRMKKALQVLEREQRFIDLELNNHE